MNMRYSEGEYNRGKQSWDFVRNNHFERGIVCFEETIVET